MWFWIVSLVLSTVLSIDQAVASGLAQDRNSKLTKAASNLANQITKDQSIMNQMKEAYSRRDVELGSAILQQSPFSSAFSLIRKAYNENKQKIKDLDKDIKNQTIAANKAQNEMNDKLAKSQSSGEIITDLITGAATSDTTAPKYESIGGKYDSKK